MWGNVMKKTYRLKFLCFLLIVTVVGCASTNKQNKKTESGIEEMNKKIEETGIRPVVVEAENFCGSWGCSQYETEPNNMPPMPLRNNTIRQIVKTSIGGKAIRIKFSNLCGAQGLEIKSAHIAVSKGNSEIDVGTDTIILFDDDSSSVVIPAGKAIYSKTFEFDLQPLTEYAITINYGSVPGKVTGHPGSRTTSYLAIGNLVSADYIGRAFTAEHWYTIEGIEIVDEAKEYCTVVCLGDSITDGRGTTTNAQNRWTDVLAQRLLENENTNKVGVINQGIGGTFVSGVWDPKSGIVRYYREVLSQNGVDYIIVLYGINDIIYLNCEPKVITDTYKKLIRQAHDRDLKIYGGTILPFGKCRDWTEEKEKTRLAVNEWIRSTAGTDEGFDAYIEFANNLKNGDNEELPESFENDGLHPTAKLYQIIGSCPDLNLFANR